MDGSRLEELIACAAARLARAHQRILPGLDLCYPRMLSEADRQAFRDLHFECGFAVAEIEHAKSELLRLARKCAELGEVPGGQS
jgi:hypothetical protein